MMNTQLMRFAVTGIGNFLLELLIFNVIDVLSHHTLTAKIVSAVIATVSSYFMNKYWVFKNESSNHRQQAVSFFAVNGVFAFISAMILQFTINTHVMHWVEKQTSYSLAINMMNMLSIVIVMGMRYFVYKHGIFKHEEPIEDLAVIPS